MAYKAVMQVLIAPFSMHCWIHKCTHFETMQMWKFAIQNLNWLNKKTDKIFPLSLNAKYPHTAILGSKISVYFFTKESSLISSLEMISKWICRKLCMELDKHESVHSNLLYTCSPSPQQLKLMLPQLHWTN